MQPYLTKLWQKARNIAPRYYEPSCKDTATVEQLRNKATAPLNNHAVGAFTRCLANIFPLRSLLLLLLLATTTTIATAQSVTITYGSSAGNTGTFYYDMPDNAIGINGKLWGGGGGGGGARAYGGGGLYRGSASAGGGGAGGYTDFSVALPGERYTIVVGNGGDGGGIVSNAAIDGISGIPSTVTDGINVYTGNHGVGGYASNISDNTQVLSEGGSGGLGGGLNGTSGEHGGAGSYSKSGFWDIQWNAIGGYGGGNPNGGGNTITGQATASTGASTSTDKRDGPSGFWPSGGGGGAVAIGGTSTATAIGGKGANGKVELQFSLPVPILSVDANPCSGGEVAVEVDNWETVNCVYSISANNGATWSAFDPDTHKAMVTMPLVTSAQNVTITVTATYSISAPGAVSIFPSATVVLTSTDVVTVHPGPVVTAADVTVCDNSTASFTPIVSGGETDLTYSWVCTSHSGITCATSGTGTSFETLTLNQDVIDEIPSAGGEASRDATYIVTPVSSAGCLGAPFTVTVTVKTSAPGLRWELFDICPIDQSNAYDSGDGDKIYVWKYREKIPTGIGSDNLWAGVGGSTRTQDVRISNSDYYNAAYDPTNAADRANNPLLQDYLKGIATNTNHWAPDTMNVANYMSNLIRWDYLVKHSSLPDTSDPEFYDRTLIGYASPFSGIKWYDYNGGVFNPGMLIRNGGEYTADSRLQDFYQNKPHAEEAYWVTVTSPDGCESQPMVVTVHLLDVGESQLIEPLIGYAQLPEANNIIDIAEYLEHVDDGITFIEYYEDFTKAEDAYYSNQPYGDASIDDMAEPQIDKTIPTVGNVPGDEYRFWITKVDNTTNCRTYPAEVVIKLYPRPTATFDDGSTGITICSGETPPVDITLTGTQPFAFTVKDGDGNTIETVSNWNSNTYSLSLSPHTQSISYRITELADFHADEVGRMSRYEEYDLDPPSEGYYDKIDITVNPLPEFGAGTFIGYTQTSGNLPWESVFSEMADLTGYHIEYYASDMSYIGTTQPVISLQTPSNNTFYLVKVNDVTLCRSAAEEYHIEVHPMPQISITNDGGGLICPGTAVNINVTVTGGTAPFDFEISNTNSSVIITETGNTGSYTFSANPMFKVDYIIDSFSDAITASITHPAYGLPTNLGSTTIDVVITEIISVTPDHGPTTGGTYSDMTNGTVTIIGRGFYGSSGTPSVTAVTFDGYDATNITVHSDTELTCTPPQHGYSGDVTVAIASQCAYVTLTDAYHYDAMMVSGIMPDYAPVTGNKTITIQGIGLAAAGYEAGVTVTLCGVPATIVSADNNEIVCIANVSSLSQLSDVVIYNGVESMTFTDLFTYYPTTFIVNGAWSTAYNWETQTDDRILPYPGADIQIKANIVQDISVDMNSITVNPRKAYTIAAGQTLEASVFTLQDDASFLNNGTMSAVEQRVEHTLAEGRNWYISSPISAGTKAMLVDATRLQSYDETAGTADYTGWLNATTFTNGWGYTAYNASTPIQVGFSGEYNDTNITSPTLTRTEATDYKPGYNLVGNPFPSYWRWTINAAANANLYSTIWYRTVIDGAYEFWTYNAAGDVAISPGADDNYAVPYSLALVPPLQAFWVRLQAGETTGTLTFDNNLRSHSDHPDNIMRSHRNTPPTEAGADRTAGTMLRLALHSDDHTDELLVYTNASADTLFDDYDSEKMFAERGGEFYTLSTDHHRLAINGLPSLSEITEIPIGLQTTEGGALTISVKQIEGMNALTPVLLDKWKKTETPLWSGATYDFTASGRAVPDRFAIAFRTIDNLGESDWTAWHSAASQITVASNTDLSLTVYDIAGSVLHTQSLSAGTTPLSRSFPAGVYLLKANNRTIKLIIP